MRYSIDTSVLINGWHKNYPPDIFPIFWERLSDLIQQGIAIASIEVLNELQKQRDDLLKWCEANRQMFCDFDRTVQTEAHKILSRYPRLIDSRPAVSPADVWVIALAKAEDAIVVTEEHPTNSSHKPKIPDVCIGLGIPCINTVQLMREQGWKFI